MNSVQAIYNFDSLGVKVGFHVLKVFEIFNHVQVDFSIVHLEIQKTRQFDDHSGDRVPMLTSFCQYQGSKNPGGDSDPKHWDIGLLLSGVDFWSADGGR